MGGSAQYQSAAPLPRGEAAAGGWAAAAAAAAEWRGAQAAVW